MFNASIGSCILLLTMAESSLIQIFIIPVGVVITNGQAEFLAKFSLKTLGTNEASLTNDMQLFDNPNINAVILSNNQK
ncbi:hypothetical protein SAMN05444360_116132 [Chryseobacterium carnipullorum]|nr:hypothetical protein SAMN05444360_116132 [Chryseobacterium carnipullorum]